MRLAAFLWFALIAALIGVLFYMKYEVQGLEKQLARIKRDTNRQHEAIHILKAEWSYLNRPDRLRVLINDRLDLQPVQRNQIKQWQLLPTRLDLPAAPTDDPLKATSPPGKKLPRAKRRRRAQ